ncbi:uncharacterized protein LOC128167505 [Crassostrea angulata]|uniref:uncharacterized protein LOC128167505 n=1 Tax=Magallana angulata TaxID=2784310 RepID=UPI0022B1D677|nr:uncharacterized protein LOC128167505 [Crassostrea angulata]XP_052689220.1 uncharacterized protein LOC128167505 [Crassostrea angulata]XP_052689223.1 uncharacterized protein LOC128167505 [Crassostrea angulata]
MGNGITERFNRTLISMLGTLDPEQKHNWKKYIYPLVHAYNSTIHDSTGYSPYFLMFGRDPILPIDLVFGLNRNRVKNSTTSAYIENLKDRLQSAYQKAQTAIKNSQEKQKSNYDSKIRGVSLKEGDRVLVRVVKFDGRHKIQDRWEDHPYYIISQPNRDIPVFKVKREDDQGKERVLHRNLLLPIGSKLTSPVPAPRIRKKKTEETEIEELSIHHQVDSDDDSIYLTGELYPVQNEDTSEDGSIPTLTGDDQESAECLEEGSREDAPNQNTEASDDPDTSSSSSSSNSSISGVLDDTQDEMHEDDDADDDDQNIPRRSTRVRQKPKWMENFVCSQLAYQPSKWKEKVLCFKEMASELKEMDKEMSKEFLKMFIKKF